MILNQIYVYTFKQVIGFSKVPGRCKSFMAPMPASGSEYFMPTSDCNVLPDLVSHLPFKLDIIQLNFIRWY